MMIFLRIPYGLIVAIDFEDNAPMFLHVLSTFLAHINSTLNSFLYVAYNPAIRQCFVDIYIKMRFKNNKTKSKTELTIYRRTIVINSQTYNFLIKKRSSTYI